MLPEPDLLDFESARPDVERGGGVRHRVVVDVEDLRKIRLSCCP
jgi:hypothetical protein